MTTAARSETLAIRLVVAVSGLMIAFQVAGRATRDALYLSHFSVTSLPRMVAVAAVISLVAALAMSRVLGRFGPGRLVPVLLAGSAVMQLGEWGLMAVAPRVAVVLVFIQFNAFGALLVSAFWSLANERFDPRTGKRIFNLIGAAGTVGGITGGLLAERAGALLSASAMLPILAAIHAISAVLVLRVRQPPESGPRAARAAEPPEPGGAPFRALVMSPYLRLLAAAVLLGTVSEGLLDYVFKAAAKGAYGHGDDLLRLFALFYTGVNVVGGTVGAVLGRLSLDKLGLARTVGMLPMSVAVGGLGAIVFPGLAGTVAARAAEATVRMSFFRSGWELLFTPLPPREKRAAKPLLDVGTVRVADVLAAGCVQLALLAGPPLATQIILATAVVAAVFGLALTVRMHAGYVGALEHSLVSRAAHLDLGPAVRDRATRLTMAQRSSIPLDLLGPDDESAAAPSADAVPANPVLARLAELYAPDAARVNRALAAGPLEMVLVPRTIALLAWDEVSLAALNALSAVAGSHTGQLVDALLDPATDFAVRRRVPMAIARAASPRAMDGLLAGLYDRRFEVRVRCGRALTRLAADAPQLVVDQARVLAAVHNEVAVDREVWESQHLEGEDADDPLAVGAALRERTSRSLEHVFTVLSLVLPREPLQIAYRGLYADDRQLRGTALEYLETALPPEVREKLWPFIGDRPHRARPSRPREEVVADLIRQRSSIVVRVEDLPPEDTPKN